MTLIEELKARNALKLPPPAERKAIRIAAGVTMDRLAEELGVHRLSVLRWERETGSNEPNPAVRYRYAELLEAMREVTA